MTSSGNTPSIGSTSGSSTSGGSSEASSCERELTRRILEEFVEHLNKSTSKIQSLEDIMEALSKAVLEHQEKNRQDVLSLFEGLKDSVGQIKEVARKHNSLVSDVTVSFTKMLPLEQSIKDVYATLHKDMGGLATLQETLRLHDTLDGKLFKLEERLKVVEAFMHSGLVSELEKRLEKLEKKPPPLPYPGDSRKKEREALKRMGFLDDDDDPPEKEKSRGMSASAGNDGCVVCHPHPCSHGGYDYDPN